MGRATSTPTTRPTRSRTCPAFRPRSRDGSTTIRETAGSRRRSNGAWTAGRRSRSSAERPIEEIVDRAFAVRPDLSRAGAGEVCVRDERTARRAALLPVLTVPREPAVLLLIEDVQRLVAQLRELRAPSCPAAHRP